jgi:hypothetical protein
MRRPERRVILPCACLLVMTATAVAEPASSEPTVEVLIAGNDTEVAALADALGDPLGRLHVRLHVRLRRGQAPAVDPEEVASPTDRAAPAVARMWFDLTEPAQAALYITDGGWKRIYVRRIALPQRLDEVAREQLTYIARTSVETLLAGGQIGVTREEFQRQLPSHATAAAQREAARPRAPGPRWHLGAGVLYEVQSYARAMPVTHGPGFDFSLLRSAPPLSPLFTTSAQLRWEEHVETEHVVARLDGAVLRLGVGAEVGLGHLLVLRGLVGGGVDLVHVRPARASDATVELSSPFWAVDPLARCSLGFGVRAGELLTWLSVGTDLAVRPSLYVVMRDGSPVNVLRPWPWRPWARLELAWDFWHSER